MQFSDGDVRGGTGQHKMLVIAALVCGLSFFGGGLAPARVDMTHNAAGDMTGMARYADADGLVPAGTTGITFGRGRKDIGFGAAAYNAQGDETLLGSFKTTDALGPLAV